MNILTIIEENYFNTLLLKFINKNLNHRFTFLLIDFDKDKFEKEINSWNLNFDYKIIETNHLSKIIRNEYHEKYLDLVSLENIKNVLRPFIKLHNLDSLILLSDFHEKNHMKSKYNNDYIKMKIIDNILEDKKFDKIFYENLDQFLIDYLKIFHLKKTVQIKNSIISFKSFIYSLSFLTFNFAKSIFYKLIFSIKKIDYSSSYLYQSYYPYLDNKKRTYFLEDQCLYFNKISKFTRKENLWILHSIKSIDTSKINFLKFLILCKSNISLLEKEIKLIDYFKIYFSLFLNLIISFKILKKISKEIDKNNYFVRYNLSKSIISKNSVYSSLAFYAYRNLFYKSKFLKKFIYLFENQSWEKAANLNKSSSFKTIGYNHTSISNEYLFFFISSLDIYSSTIKKSLPNIIAANSFYSKDILLKYYSNIKIKNVESLRHHHLDHFKYETNKLEKNILFLFSIERYECKLLYNLLNEIVNDKRFNSYSIYLKFHPSLKIKISKNISKQINIINNEDYNYYLKKSKFIVCGTSSSSIEALYSGGTILVPNSILTYFKPPIYDFPELINIFNSTDEFYKIIIDKNEINIDKVNDFKKLYWNTDYSLPKKLKRIIDE